MLALALLSLLIFLGYLYHAVLWEKGVQFYRFFSDREKVEAFVEAFGKGAPIALIVIQILQVAFAPFPGEATGGFVGALALAARCRSAARLPPIASSLPGRPRAPCKSRATIGSQ